MNLIYIYNNDRCIAAYQESKLYFENNRDAEDKVNVLGVAYQTIEDSVPQTEINWWSGHSFPITESWNDLQISTTLCLFGLYKQAYVALRSALELGLLSVYYNIDDKGHDTVKDWYYSNEEREADTPRNKRIWKLLLSNPRIKKYNDKYNLESDFYKLSFFISVLETLLQVL